MSKASIPASILKPGEERRIQRGHFWLYRNEFANLPELADGDVFDVFTPNRRFVCRAFYQETGGIAARALSRHQDPVDHAWFKQRFDDALRLRERLFPGSRVYRWVHGESDMLPGLVVDRYGTVAAVQTACAFYRSRRDLLADLLLGVEGVETAVFLDADGLECRGTPLEEQRLDVDGVAVSLSLGSAQKTGP